MAAALTATAPAATYKVARLAWTLNVTGASNATAYTIEVTGPSGAHTIIEVTTDGSGAASALYVPMTDGSFTATLRPTAEYRGTTTAAASLAATVVNPFN